MQVLLLDLRSNPGGLLSQAVDVSDIFLDTGELVVSTKGRIDEQNQSYYARTPARFDRSFPIITLVNGGSASASEILAGSIQDWDRGVVAGTTSFGKGSVQTLMRLRPLTKDCAMKITTAKWYMASGRAIEKPEHWIVEELAEGEEAEAEPEKPQYRTAGGRVVYGGGGVTPDVVIEPVSVPDVVVDLERREEFFEFAIDYVAANGAPASFDVTAEIWQAFVDFLERDEFEFEEDELEESRSGIELRIKRDMVRHVSGREEAYAVSIRGDEQLNRTIEILGRARDLQELFDVAESYDSERLGMN